MPAELVEIDPRRIRLDAWNARGEDAREPDEGLLLSIRELGILEPPGVMLLEDEIACVYGFRRVRAAVLLGLETIAVVAVPYHERKLCNLAENLHRRNLRTWEVAEALDELSSELELSPADLAIRVGLSENYVKNLLRMRRKLAPAVWAQVRTWGVSERLSVEFLIEICALSWDEQIERYNEALDLTRGARRGNEVAPGRAKIRKMLARIEQNPEVVREGQGFAAGIRYALRVVLGREAWRHGGVISDRTRRKRNKEKQREKNNGNQSN